MRTNVAAITCALIATSGVIAAPIAEPATGALVRAGSSAIIKYAPKVAPHVTKQLPKAVKHAPTVGARVSGLVKYLKGFRPGQIKKLLPWAEAILVGWGVRDAADTLSDEFRGVDWSEVEEEEVDDATAVPEEEEAEEAAAGSPGSTPTPDPVTKAGMTGGGSEFDTVEPVPTEPDSVEAEENAVDPNELTLEQLDQIEAGIDRQEQDFGDSPDPSLNPFFNEFNSI